MSTVTFPTPIAAYATFVAAATSGNLEVATAAAAPDCWVRRGESALKVFGQASQGFVFDQAGDPIVVGARAVVPAAVRRESDPLRRQRLFFLLERAGPSWGVAAAIAEPTQAAVFLRGDLPAIVEVQELPPDPRVDAQLARTVATLGGQALLTARELSEAAGAPVLGLLPRWAESGAAGFSALPDDDPALLAYGDLIHQLFEADLGQALALASATRHEGATAVAGHLGQLLSALGGSTLLLDLDFASPSLHALFGSLDPAPGLSDALLDRRTPGTLVRELGPELHLLTAGRPEQPSPQDFDRFAAWLAATLDLYDHVIALTPPQGLGPLAGLGLAPILVAHAGAVPAAAVAALRAGLGDRPLAGVVATRLTPESVPDPDLDPSVLRQGAEGAPHTVQSLGSHGLPAIDRAIGGIARSAPGQDFPLVSWTVFDTAADPPKALRSASDPTIELLLTGVQAELPGADAPPPPPDPTAVLGALLSGLGQAVQQAGVRSPADLPQAMADAVAQALDAAGRGPEAQELRRHTERELRKARAQAQAEQQAARRTAARARAGQPTPTAPDPVRDELREAVVRYARSIDDPRPPEELLVDQTFIDAHGAALTREVMRSVLQAFAPKKPAPVHAVADDPQGLAKGTKVGLKMDLAAMLERAAAAARRAGPATDTDDARDTDREEPPE